MKKNKTHIFAENLTDEGQRTWKYGNSTLTEDEVLKVKKRLPEGSKIITINFADPADYHYPGENEIFNNLNTNEDVKIQEENIR